MRRNILDIAIDLAGGKTTSKAISDSVLSKYQSINKKFGAVILDGGVAEITAAALKIDELRGNCGIGTNSAYSLPILAGIPISIKDNFNVTGTKTTAGSEMLGNFISPYDATVVENIRKSFGIPSLKANMDEFGMGSSMLNSAFGPCVNPWSPPNDHRKITPGGSSGASAVAVACGLVPAAVGSDTGGSIRQPASFCGIVGLKPTYGLLSRHGLISYASSMDTPGVLTNNVVDAAIMLDALSGPDARDPNCVLAKNTNAYRKITPSLFNAPSWSQSNRGIVSPPSMSLEDLERMRHASKKQISLKGLMVGVLDEFNVRELDATARIAWETGIRILEDAGAIVTRVSAPSLKLALPCYYVLACAEASSNLAKYDGVRYGRRCEAMVTASDSNNQQNQAFDLQAMIGRSRSEGFGPEVVKRILTGTFVLSESFYHAYYHQAIRIRGQIRDEIDQIFSKDGVHLLVGLTAPNLPFPIDNPPDAADMLINDFLTVPANLAGIPAISIPVGISRPAGNDSSHFFEDLSLPIGMQLLAPRFGEETLIKAALAVEQNIDFQSCIPKHVYL